MTPPPFSGGSLQPGSACFNNSARQDTFHMTICDNTATKPCPDRMCDRDRRVGEYVESLDRVVWYITFRPKRVIYVNPAFTAFWGIDREELYNNPRLWMARVHRDDRTRVERAFASWISNGSRDAYEIEYRVVRADLSIRRVRDVVTGLFDIQGSLCGSSGILEDITEQEMPAENLRDQGTINVDPLLEANTISSDEWSR